MTEEIYNDCRFCENGRCRVYPWTCDYDDYCSSNEECPIKEMIVKFKRLEQENKELKTWLESKEKQLKQLIEYNQNKKDQIKTLKFMLFDEKEIPKDKFTMMYRIAQNERRTKSHRDLCTNITKKYRSALEEIRQINNKWLKRWMNDSDELMGFEEIGNKIKEVLNGI